VPVTEQTHLAQRRFGRALLENEAIAAQTDGIVAPGEVGDRSAEEPPRFSERAVRARWVVTDGVEALDHSAARRVTSVTVLGRLHVLVPDIHHDELLTAGTPGGLGEA
jgi:hypothetical protein